MAVKEILAQIAQIAKDNNIHEPYIVGGLPRDKVLGRESDIGDIDLTTGNADIVKLAKLTAAHFYKLDNNLKPKQAPDGHFDMKIQGIDFDFSSNKMSPNIDTILRRAKIKGTPLLKESLSRDFTCNTLLATLDLKTIKDPTGMGIRDIRRKLIRTPLPPRITLRDNPDRIIRAVYLSAKLNFDIEPDIIKWALRNPSYLKNISESYVRTKLGKGFKFNAARTVAAMDAMKLWDKIPFVADMLPYIGERL